MLGIDGFLKIVNYYELEGEVVIFWMGIVCDLVFELYLEEIVVVLFFEEGLYDDGMCVLCLWVV